MKIKCPHCAEIIGIDDKEIRQYLARQLAGIKSEAKAEASRAAAKKPRPGAKGKKKPRKIVEAV